MVDLAEHYRQARHRVSALLGGADGWDQPVPACPGWDVKAVVSHLVGVIEDGMAGRIDGPPGEDLTAEEVARHAADAPAELLARWDELAPAFEHVVGQLAIWPAVIDVVTHEHDIRGALGRPGARHTEFVRLAARSLVEGLALPAAIRFELDDGPVTSPPANGEGAPAWSVATTSFEVLRLRLGRRSARQVVALPWRPAPGPPLDGLFVFGPRSTDLVE